MPFLDFPSRPLARCRPARRVGALGCVVIALLTGAGHCVVARASSPAPSEARVARFLDIFSPLQSDSAALSPDGRFLAYAFREGTNLSVAVVEIARPAQVLTKVLVATDELATPMHHDLPGKVTAQLLHLSWCGPRRVAVMTNGVSVFGDEFGWLNGVGQVLAFDLDGANSRFVAGSREFAWPAGVGARTRLVPREFRVLGVDPDTPNSLLVELTRKLEILAEPKDPLTFKWPTETEVVQLSTLSGKFSVVHRREAARKQALRTRREQTATDQVPAVLAALRSAIPHHEITICDSDERRQRFLARVQSEIHPGSFHIFDRSTRRSLDLIRCAPAVDVDRITKNIPLKLTGALGTPIRGTLTLPRRSRTKPFPLLVVYPSANQTSGPAVFQPELLAFAEMGLAVLLLQPPIAEFRPPAGNDDDEPGPAHPNILAAIDAAAAQHPLDLRRVALFSSAGTAASAYELLLAGSERFRAGIVFLPELPEDWHSPPHPEGVDRSAAPPLQVFTAPGNDRRDFNYRRTRTYTSDYRRGGAFSELVILPLAYNAQLPEARAAAFAQIDEFLNAAFDGEVVLGPLTETPDQQPVAPKAPVSP